MASAILAQDERAGDSVAVLPLRVLCIELAMEHRAALLREQERSQALIRALCNSIQAGAPLRDVAPIIVTVEQHMREREPRIGEARELAARLERGNTVRSIA